MTPSHSASLTAARGRCDLFEWRQQLHSTDKLPQGAAISTTSWCSRGLRPHPHHLAEESSSVFAELVQNKVLAADGADSCERHACLRCERRKRAGNGMPRECGPRGPCMHRMYRFIRNFLLATRLASACVPVCRMGMSSGRGTLTVTFYDRLSWRVYYACREVRLRLRARVHTDQDDLW